MSSPDPTLLLQELLSPPSRSSNEKETLQLITYHLSTLPLSSPHLGLISLIARYTLSSPSLWTSTSSISSNELSSLTWSTSTAVHSAYFQSTLLRLDQISREQGTGFRARRSISTYLSTLSDGIWADRTRRKDSGGYIDPVHRLLLLNAVLAGLQEWKRRREKLWIGGRGMLDRIEAESGQAWQEWSIEGDRSDKVPAWLAAQTISSVDAVKLARDFPVPSLLVYMTDMLSITFSKGELFSSPPLASDLAQTDEGLSWTTPSPSFDHLTAITQSPLFSILGPLSRAIGRLLTASATLASSYDSTIAEPNLTAIRDLSQTLLSVTSRLSSGWSNTPWSDLVEDSSLAPSTRSQTQPWTILKSLLFSQTLIYSSLLEVLSSSLSNGQVNEGGGTSGEVTKEQRELARQAVVALGRTYFVASRFGTGGFKAWRAVLAGLVDVAAAPFDSDVGDVPSAAEQLAREMQPLATRGDEEGGKHSRLVLRAEVTFWMNTVEQVMEELSDRYVEDVVLPRCKPYLEDDKYTEPFESAHSVVLAVFSTNKAVVPKFAPWYTLSLLQTNSSRMSPTQLRLAFTTMVTSVSTFDDALAWWCIRELIVAIERLPVLSAASSTSNDTTRRTGTSTKKLRDLEEQEEKVEMATVADELVSSPRPTNTSTTQQPSSLLTDPPPTSTSTPTIESRALTLPRGLLLLTLTSLLSSTNLVLFHSLLSQIRRFISMEPIESDGRYALTERVFETLGNEIDVVKREIGVKWWLENRNQLVEGFDNSSSSSTETEEKKKTKGENESSRIVDEL